MLKAFSNEIDQIVHIEFRELVKRALDEGPHHILTLPSSTTGKYHPPDERNSRGMIIHIKRVVEFAKEVTNMYDLGARTRDILIAGALLHDQYKVGMGDEPLRWTHKLHPYWAAAHVSRYIDGDTSPLVTEMMMTLSNACLWHEGRWTDSECVVNAVKDGCGQDMPCKVAKCLHIADFFASRESVYHVMQPQGGDETQTGLNL